MEQSGAPGSAHRGLGLANRLFYGLGSTAFGVKDNGFSFLLLLFYNQVVGLSAPLVGLALMIALIVDACVDPLIGQWSDNLRTAWGRRHPFMYAAALPLAVSYAALWSPPHWSQPMLFWYLLAATIVVRIFISFYEVPSSALAAEFSEDYDDRSSLLAYRFFFAMLGGLTLSYVTFAVLLKPDHAHPVGQLNPIGYAHYGVAAGAVMFVTIVASTLGTHRYIPQLKRPPPRRRLRPGELAREAAASLAIPSFGFLMLSSIATAMAGGLSAALSNYFGTFYWALDAKQLSYLSLGVYASAVIALVCTRPLTRRFGKRPTAMTLMALSVTVNIAPLVLRLMGLMPPNHSQALFEVILFTSILGYVCTVISGTMAASMIADVVEASELKTGRRSEGLFFAASTFVGKAVSGFGVLAASLIIGAVRLSPGADPAAASQSAVRELALIYCPVVIALYAAAWLLLRGYKITRSSHEDALRRLADRAQATATGG